MRNNGGVVTAVERHPKKAKMYLVYIEDELAFTIHEDVLIMHRLFKGQEIDSSLAEQITVDAERQRAWAEAVAYIGRRPRALREIKVYLKRKGHQESLIEEALKRLEDNGYVDDAQFAAQMAEHRIISQRKGRRWVQQELQQKGVNREVIQEALAQVGPEEEQAAASQLAQKKWASMQGEPADKRRKLMAFMMRRGYSGSLVSTIIRDLLSREEVQAMEEEWQAETDWEE
ncbi:MAG: RecX family transcriptional regulator [Paenibacillus sp.]|nr:RecX family transcriptional regulator [Paenibacillus sp.]